MDIEKIIETKTNKYKEDLLKAIKNTKTKDVVYCKDCEFLEISGAYGECGRAYLGIVSPYDYCSRGQRKAKKEG